MKIMNAYAGIGGNRKLWKNVEVTAIEYSPEIAQVYQDLFPQDEVIVADAHEYIMENYSNYDFIWSSPPCQTHSSFRQNIGVRYRGVKAVYPDMRLYQEILFLKYNFAGLWVVENVKPYYDVLIEPSVSLHRHLLWSNFDIAAADVGGAKIRSAQIPDLQELHGFDLSAYKLKNKRQILRNCVHPPLGVHVLNCALSNSGLQPTAKREPLSQLDLIGG